MLPVATITESTNTESFVTEKGCLGNTSVPKTSRAQMPQSWRDCSSTSNTCCPCRGSEFSSSQSFTWQFHYDSSSTGSDVLFGPVVISMRVAHTFECLDPKGWKVQLRMQKKQGAFNCVLCNIPVSGKDVRTAFVHPS